MYLADAVNNVVVVCDMDGKVVRKYGSFDEKEQVEVRFKELYNVFITSGRVYVVDVGQSKIYVFKKSKGELSFSFGEKGGTEGKLAMPSSVVVDGKGRVLVLDRKRHCIDVFDELGEFKGEVGGEGQKPGWFYYPLFMTIDKKDNIYICEALISRVQVVKIPELKNK
jgi:outer membrane protein assembly factor BamB